MSIYRFKQALFCEFAGVAKALSNPSRLELLEFLAQGERNVEALAKIANLRVANTSQHLQQLRRAGLVTTRKDGQNVYYRLADDEVVTLINALRRVAQKNLAEVDRLVNTYLNVKDDLEPVRVEELMARVRQGSVTVLDVRPREEYAAGHLPDAINIPVAELAKHLHTLEPSKEIVAYCRGPYCVLAYDAVARLRAEGFTARRLKDGYPEWKQAGLPVEQS